MPSPTRLAVFENRVFWSDSTKQGIMSVNKYEGSSSIQAVFKSREVKDPKAVKIIHSLLQKQGMVHGLILCCATACNLHVFP